MRIKIRAKDVINVCEKYEAYIELNNKNVKRIINSDDTFNEICYLCKESFFVNIKHMAEYADNSNFPYLIINQKEFNKMEKYL